MAVCAISPFCCGVCDEQRAGGGPAAAGGSNCTAAGGGGATAAGNGPPGPGSGGPGGAGGSGVVIVNEPAIDKAVASSCWDLRVVYKRIVADDWV